MKKNTVDFDHAKINRDLIRQLEDPEYAKAAEEYEKQARAARAGKHHKSSSSYEDYIAAREGKHGKHSRQAQRRNVMPDAGASGQRSGQQGGGAMPNVRQVEKNGSRRRGGQNSAVGTVQSVRSSARRGRKEKKPASVKVIVTRVVVVVLILLVLLLGILGYNVWKVTSHLERVDTDVKDFGISPSVEETLSDYRHIAILGSDARKNEGYDGSRTDAIIILSINKKTGDARLLSVMRDSYLLIEGPDGDKFLDKVTHAHAFGGGMDTTRALNRNLDLNIEEYVVFNWKAVADTVDTLGGIEVDVKKKELKDLNHWGKSTGKNVGRKFHKVKHAGVQTLDGVQATTYCRIRKTSGGDQGRGERYKKVVSGVMKKMVSQPWKADELATKVMPQIRTNMSQMQLTGLMLKMPGMDMQKSVAWPKKYYGGIVGGVWYAVPTTLESNVKTLHKKAFGQEGYKPSKTCRKISDKIIEETGLS